MKLVILYDNAVTLSACVLCRRRGEGGGEERGGGGGGEEIIGMISF